MAESKEYEKDMQEMNKPLKDWIIKMYGKKCPDFEAGCACCQAWKCYAYLAMK